MQANVSHPRKGANKRQSNQIQVDEPVSFPEATYKRPGSSNADTLLKPHPSKREPWNSLHSLKTALQGWGLLSSVAFAVSITLQGKPWEASMFQGFPETPKVLQSLRSQFLSVKNTWRMECFNSRVCGYLLPLVLGYLCLWLSIDFTYSHKNMDAYSGGKWRLKCLQEGRLLGGAQKSTEKQEEWGRLDKLSINIYL